MKDVYPPLLDLSEQPDLRAVADEDAPAPWMTLADRPAIQVGAYDSLSKVSLMRVRRNDEPWVPERPFTGNAELPNLPIDEPSTLSVQVRDAAGNWSAVEQLTLARRRGAPKLAGDPIVRTNAHGVCLTFSTDAACRAHVTFAENGPPARPEGDEKTPLRRAHAAAHVAGQVQVGAVRYAIFLEGVEGGLVRVREGAARLAGELCTLHVDPAGKDAEDRGAADQPWRRVQYALDRALPGDTIVLAPGLYSAGGLLSHRGVPGAPITIRAAEKWAAVIDGRHRTPHLLQLRGAPHVVVDGLELRWYTRAAILLTDSPHVTIRNCKVWNDFWGTWRFGDAVVAWSSPHLAAERNLIFLKQHGLVLHESPSARLVHNTFLKHMQGAVLFIESVRGSVLRNNCMTFNGNRAFMLRVKHIDELASFNLDYNNLGTKLRYWKPSPGAVPNLASKPKFLGSSKTLVSVNSSGEPIRGEKYAWRLGEEGAREGRTRVWLRQIETWRRFSGNDAHSIFAHARHHNVAELDFELDPDSPNIGAAEHGKTIGAMGVRQAD